MTTESPPSPRAIPSLASSSGSLRVAPVQDQSSSRLAPKKKRRIYIFAALVILLLIVGIGAFLFYHSFFEGTDDAQIAAHTSDLSPKVGGKIAAVYVDENEQVKAGELLLQIDPRDYQTRLHQAEAEFSSAQSEQENADLNFRRATNLIRSGAVTRQQFDAARTASRKAQANVGSLRAQVEQAQLDLEYTQLRAPENGRIGRRSAEVGMVISLGQPLLNFVPTELPWVNANFKETQLRHMKPGQRVEISIDSIDKTFNGQVSSFSPATGAEFAIIPPENATGNYIKIVQRVPVKVVFDPQSVRGYESRLVAGSSVEVKVFVK